MRSLLWLLASASAIAATPLMHARASEEYVHEVPKDFRGPKHLRSVVEKRQSIATGQPYDPASGKGSVFSGGTNSQLDLANPANLDGESTDAGTVVNLKWSFSDSKIR